MADKVERPEIVEDDHLDYLDTLRESGVTNMYGAPAYIEQAFDLDRRNAKKIVQYWMDTFGDEDR